MTESCQIIKEARSTFQIGDKLCWFCSHETCSRNPDWTPQCGCVDKSSTWKKEDLRGGYSPPNPFTACHQRQPPSFPFPPSDPDDSKVVDVAVEEVETVVVEEQGPDDSPPRPSSGSPKWQELPLKVAFYSTTARVIFQMPALTLGHISNVNIVLRTLATFFKDGLQIQNSM